MRMLKSLDRELLKYLDKLVDQRLADAKGDLISKLAVEQLKPGHIDKSDAVQIAFLLLVAGNATMVNMIALVSFLVEQGPQTTDINSGRCRASPASRTVIRTQIEPVTCLRFCE